MKDEQRRLAADKDRRLRLVQTEPSRVVAGDAELVAHALVLPTGDVDDRRRHDAKVEEIAMRIAQAHDEASGAATHDVSRPDLARRAGLGDWPGFDLLSVAPAGARRAIEVKGRARTGDIELTENEWAKACNLRAGYWALRRLRLRDAPAAPRAGPRPVREASGERSGLFDLLHSCVVGARCGG